MPPTPHAFSGSELYHIAGDIARYRKKGQKIWAFRDI
jgi:hypothetical protein